MDEIKCPVCDSKKYERVRKESNIRIYQCFKCKNVFKVKTYQQVLPVEETRQFRKFKSKINELISLASDASEIWDEREFFKKEERKKIIDSCSYDSSYKFFERYFKGFVYDLKTWMDNLNKE
ncbi:MAG: hypothetical protein ACOCP8_06230 [archaeon]